jgi:aldose 1-epimerase
VDEEMIPTGVLRPVAGTPLDFRKPTPIGAVINANDAQLKIANGFDHNWTFDKPHGKLTLLAHVEDPASGRILDVLSTEPGLQLYTADFGDGSKGKGGQVYRHRASLCLEPQHYPDAPNHPEFPSIVLKPGETYRNTIIYQFSHRR